jgi:hypothetical protein
MLIRISAASQQMEIEFGCSLETKTDFLRREIQMYANHFELCCH